MSDFIFRELSTADKEMIKDLFASVFTAAPWFDDWSDEAQLDAYILDLISQGNSLSYGLFAGDELAAISLGHIKHWYTGTEYCIDELCVRTALQGQGIGTRFMELICGGIKERGLSHIFLLTEKTVPAFEYYRKNGFRVLEDSVSLAKKV